MEVLKHIIKLSLQICESCWVVIAYCNSLSYYRTEDDVLLLGSKLDDMLDEKGLFNEDELRKSKELSATEEKLRKEIHELESIDIEVHLKNYSMLHYF